MDISFAPSIQTPSFENQGATMVAINTAVLSQSLDTIEVLGEGMIKMMEASVAPNLGQNIDIQI